MFKHFLRFAVVLFAIIICVLSLALYANRVEKNILMSSKYENSNDTQEPSQFITVNSGSEILSVYGGGDVPAYCKVTNKAGEITAYGNLTIEGYNITITNVSETQSGFAAVGIATPVGSLEDTDSSGAIFIYDGSTLYSTVTEKPTDYTVYYNMFCASFDGNLFVGVTEDGKLTLFNRRGEIQNNVSLSNVYKVTCLSYSNTGFVISGSTSDLTYKTSQSSAFISSFDKEGKELWTTPSMNDYVASGEQIVLSSNGDIYLLGNYSKAGTSVISEEKTSPALIPYVKDTFYTNPWPDKFMLRLDSSGNILNTSLYLAEADIVPFAFLVGVNDDIQLLAYSAIAQSESSEFYKGCLIKTDENFGSLEYSYFTLPSYALLYLVQNSEGGIYTRISYNQSSSSKTVYYQNFDDFSNKCTELSNASQIINSINYLLNILPIFYVLTFTAFTCYVRIRIKYNNLRCFFKRCNLP